MLNVLEDVRNSVRTVQVHIALLLVHEGHIPHRLEELPGGNEILYYADIGTRLDVEVSCIEISAHIQAWNKFKRLVFGVGCRTLPVEVEVVGARRSLEITLLERFPVPYPVGLVHEHMVHMYRHPHVRGGIGNLVIDLISYYEIIGLHIAVLQEIYARLTDLAEVELDIIVFVIRSPRADFPAENLPGAAVIFHLPHGSTGKHLVRLVELNDRNFRLLRKITYLREAHVRLPYPSLDGIRLHEPADYLACLPGRKFAAQHIPAVLGQDAAVVKLEFRILGSDLDHARRIVRGEEHLVSALHRERIHELARAAVVVGTVALVLFVLLAVRARHGLGHGIAWKAARTSVHDISLVPVLGRKELEIESRIPGKFLRDRFIEIHIDAEGLSLSGDNHPGVKVIVFKTKRNFYGIVFNIHLALRGRRHEVPLFRCAGKPHCSSLDGTHAVVDNLYSGVFLIVETAGEKVAVHEYIYSLFFEILQIIQHESIVRFVIAAGREKKSCGE